MTIEEFTAELDAKLASMTKLELVSALEEAGFELEAPMDDFWPEDPMPLFEGQWEFEPQYCHQLALAA
ncbi:hypothetical protein [Verrucomicrobium spinosum]|uniref:hypothetical protein n=1 Tax=Verrucomicrobium spinosum TaxID=2736 RepID=UPI0001744EAD|nr:hypothetical protein [Verrucomicrobium spinosum]